MTDPLTLALIVLSLAAAFFFLFRWVRPARNSLNESFERRALVQSRDYLREILERLPEDTPLEQRREAEEKLAEVERKLDLIEEISSEDHKDP
ncbi:hypothetical protein JW848_00390 [Candidatus Bipolaricaulota bacterium]|nr:hypothetical protein [Candidatus Bipolaricaulota bacterium]